MTGQRRKPPQQCTSKLLREAPATSAGPCQPVIRDTVRTKNLSKISSIAFDWGGAPTSGVQNSEVPAMGEAGGDRNGGQKN